MHSKEAKVQLMLSLNQLFVAQKRLKAQTRPSDTAASAPSDETAPKDPSWTQIVQEMEAMKPHFAGCLKESAEFAAAWSGGDDSPGLNEA